MKRRSSPRVTTEGRLPHRWLPECTALFGVRPRGLGFALDCINTYKEGCSASAARQALAQVCHLSPQHPMKSTT